MKTYDRYLILACFVRPVRRGLDAIAKRFKRLANKIWHIEESLVLRSYRFPYQVGDTIRYTRVISFPFQTGDDLIIRKLSINDSGHDYRIGNFRVQRDYDGKWCYLQSQLDYDFSEPVHVKRSISPAFLAYVQKQKEKWG